MFTCKLIFAKLILMKGNSLMYERSIGHKIEFYKKATVLNS